MVMFRISLWRVSLRRFPSVFIEIGSFGVTGSSFAARLGLRLLADDSRRPQPAHVLFGTVQSVNRVRQLNDRRVALPAQFAPIEHVHRPRNLGPADRSHCAQPKLPALPLPFVFSALPNFSVVSGGVRPNEPGWTRIAIGRPIRGLTCQSRRPMDAVELRDKKMAANFWLAFDNIR